MISRVPASSAVLALFLTISAASPAFSQDVSQQQAPPKIPAAIQALIDLRRDAEERAAGAMQRVYVLQEQLDGKKDSDELKAAKDSIKNLERELQSTKAELAAETKNVDAAHDIISKQTNCPQPSKKD